MLIVLLFCTVELLNNIVVHESPVGDRPIRTRALQIAHVFMVWDCTLLTVSIVRLMFCQLVCGLQISNFISLLPMEMLRIEQLQSSET